MEEVRIEQPTPPTEPTIAALPTHRHTILYVVTALLFAGMIGIYLLHFLQKNEARPIPPAALYNKAGGITVAFVNSDSIKSNYLMVKDMQKVLEQKFATLDNEIRAKQLALENKAAELQKKYEARQMTQEEAARQQQLLQEESKRVYDLNQEYSGRMAQEESKMNTVFIDSIDNYLKRYNKTYNFDYILGYSRGGGILFAKDTLDITADVLKGLNDEYLKKK
jgi:outer membrane protein